MGCLFQKMACRFWHRYSNWWLLQFALLKAIYIGHHKILEMLQDDVQESNHNTINFPSNFICRRTFVTEMVSQSICSSVRTMVHCCFSWMSFTEYTQRWNPQMSCTDLIERWWGTRVVIPVNVRSSRETDSLKYRTEIQQAPQQLCCRISYRFDNSKCKSRGFETVLDLAITRLIEYCNGSRVH